MEHTTRILAIRHGETAWNVDSRIQGHLDIALNDIGRWQAHRVAQAVREEGLSALYSSDLARAFETAQCVADATGLGGAAGPGVVREPGLRERAFGVFEGLTYNEIETRWPVLSERWRRRDPQFGAEGGETLQTFYDRCVSTVLRIAAAHPGQTIAIVAHGGVMDCLYRAATRVDLRAPRSWQLGNASINRLLCTEGGLTLVGWSDTSHLEHAARDETSDGHTEAALLGRPDRVGPAA